MSEVYGAPVSSGFELESSDNTAVYTVSESETVHAAPDSRPFDRGGEEETDFQPPQEREGDEEAEFRRGEQLARVWNHHQTVGA